MLVPDLGALGAKLPLLESFKAAGFVAQLQGLPNAHAFADVLVAQLGVDPRSEKSLIEAGLDPHGALGVAGLSEGRLVSVVAISDAAKFKGRLTSLAKDRLGAGVVGQAGEVTTFARAANGAPALGYLIRDGYAYVGPEAVIGELARLSALPAQDSLAQDDLFNAALKRLPSARDLIVYVPPASLLLGGGSFKGGVIVASLTPQALTVRADLAGTGAAQTLGLLEKAAGPDLLATLPSDAFAVVRLGADPARAGPYWRRLVGPALAKAADLAHFDLQTEILDNLQPGAVLSLSVAPDVKLGAGLPALDVRQTNPFRFVHLVAAAAVRDATKAQLTFDKLPGLGAVVGAKLTPADRNGHKVLVTSYSQGEGVHVALAGDRLVAASPLSRLDASLEQVKNAKGPGPLTDPTLRQALEAGALGAVVDLQRFAASVKALPSEAWGVGGFAIKATTVRWLEATDDLRAITVAIDAKGGAVQVEVSLKLAPK